MWARVFIKRFIRRIRFALRFKEMWEWQYESCEECGSNFRWCWAIKDELWSSIYGSSNGTLCPDCTIKRGLKKGIRLKDKDFEHKQIFQSRKIKIPPILPKLAADGTFRPPVCKTCPVTYSERNEAPSSFLRFYFVPLRGLLRSAGKHGRYILCYNFNAIPLLFIVCRLRCRWHTR